MEWLLGLSGVILFFLGPIGFFIAIGNGRRLTALEREIERLRADLARGAVAAALPAGLDQAEFGAPSGLSPAQPDWTPPRQRNPLRSRPPLRLLKRRRRCRRTRSIPVFLNRRRLRTRRLSRRRKSPAHDLASRRRSAPDGPFGSAARLWRSARCCWCAIQSSRVISVPGSVSFSASSFRLRLSAPEKSCGGERRRRRSTPSRGSTAPISPAC